MVHEPVEGGVIHLLQCLHKLPENGLVHHLHTMYDAYREESHVLLDDIHSVGFTLLYDGRRGCEVHHFDVPLFHKHCVGGKRILLTGVDLTHYGWKSHVHDAPHQIHPKRADTVPCSRCQ